MTKLRKPSASAERGLKNILTEMQTIAEDMSTYRSKEERQRGRDILAGLAYIERAIQLATVGVKGLDDAQG
jgi:hypothetical protein